MVWDSEPLLLGLLPTQADTSHTSASDPANPSMASQLRKRKEPPAGTCIVGPDSKYVPEEHRPGQLAVPVPVPVPVEVNWNNLNAPNPLPEPSTEELQPLEKRLLTRKELAKRDFESVAYTRSLLVEGDTLVYIKYPGESKCFDSTGFEISAAPHRVHSSRLLATGSKIFAKMLNPTYQFRILRRKRLIGHLPVGVLYVMDLTPPDEGDEAVELTSELSCSLGVRLWFTSAQRCGIVSNLVGGEDEVLVVGNTVTYGPHPPDTGSSGSQNVYNEISSTSQPEDDEMKIGPGDWDRSGLEFQNDDMNKAIELSLDELSKANTRSLTSDALKVPEYCPARHRAGIARLLQVIEGKNPRLDSAPKVWTLFVLAKYFDCTAAVVDWIITWIMADPNTQFIEILPEASCRMAFGLKNQLICRAAFSILVSEESLSLASRELGLARADKCGTNQFGRLREDIDEDLRTRIEYASKSFAGRVSSVFEGLVGEGMSWVSNLPEYQILERFTTEISNLPGQLEKYEKWVSEADDLKNALRMFVMTSILGTLSTALSRDQVLEANRHRRIETYASEPVDGTFYHRYNRLHRNERIFTRFFWKIVKSLDFPLHSNGGLLTKSNPDNERAYLLDRRPSVSKLVASQSKANESILEAIKAKCYNSGFCPPEAVFFAERRQAFIVNNGPGPSVTPKSDLLKPQNKSPRFTIKSWDLAATHNSNSDELQNQRVSAKLATVGDNDEFFEVRPRTPPASTSWKRTLDVRTKDVDQSWIPEDLDKYIAESRLANMVNNLRTTHNGNGRTSPNRPEEQKTDLPLRPKPFPLPFQQRNSLPSYGNPISFPSLQFSQSLEHPFSSSVLQNPGSNETHGDEVEPFCDGDGQVRSFIPPAKCADDEELGNMADTKLHSTAQNMDDAQPQLTTDRSLNYGAPMDCFIPKDSPFFRLSRFFDQAKSYIDGVADAMLDTRELGFDVTVTDTVLCLGPEEFKYLPLWAGGDDDGSGGVFDDMIPAAVAGPNGPGPSFHTGFSSASDASSEFDTRSQITSFNTSVGVEDGYSDHIDRRVVIADDDFHSETFSDDSEVYDRKGKGVDRGDVFQSAPPSSTTAFSVAGDEAENVAGTNFDMMYDDDDDDDDADTTIGQFDQDEDAGANNDDDDEDNWDGGDDESFDFGNIDEDMNDE